MEAPRRLIVTDQLAQVPYTERQDGLHYDVPFEDYLRWPVISQSALKEGRRSMAHFRAAVLGERTKTPTDDMILGSAIHTCFLEPRSAQDRIAVWTGGRRFGKEWEAFKAENPGRILLTENQSEKLYGMVQSLRLHPEVRKWSDNIEAVEVSALGAVHGLRMRGRCDALTPDPLIDLKKVADGSAYKVVRSVLDYGYDVQAWVYCQLFNRDRFMLITVEDEPPFDVAAYELSPGFMRRGERIAKELIDDVLMCESTGIWPGRATAPVLLEPPDYAIDDE